MMQEYVDSSSVYEIVSVYRHDQPEDTYEWAWQSSLAVTSSILTIPKLVMPPPPSIRGAPSGPYGQLMGELNELLQQNSVQQCPDIQLIENANRAQRATKAWVGRYPQKLAIAYENLKSDSCYNQWLEGYCTTSWNEYTTRLGGLFNYEFIPQIARILETDEERIRGLWEFSLEPRNLDRLLQSGGDDLVLMKDAFIISGLIRGRYYDHIAKGSGMQIMQHPFRREIALSRPKDNQKREYQTTNVEKYLSNIILAGGFSERNQYKRILNYSENVYRARLGVMGRKVNLGPADSEDDAIESAIESAKALRIRTYPGWIEKVIDVCHLLGVTSISMVLSPWEGALLNVVDYSVSKKINLSEEIPHRIHGRKSRLYELATSVPGRIESIKAGTT